MRRNTNSRVEGHNGGTLGRRMARGNNESQVQGEEDAGGENLDTGSNTVIKGLREEEMATVDETAMEPKKKAK